LETHIKLGALHLGLVCRPVPFLNVIMANKTKTDFQQKFSKLGIKSDSLNELSPKDLEDLETISMCVEGSFDALYSVLDDLPEFYKCCFIVTIDRFWSACDNQIDEDTDYAFDFVDFIKSSISGFNALSDLNDSTSSIDGPLKVAVNVSNSTELLELIERIDMSERLHDTCYTISYLSSLPSDRIFLSSEEGGNYEYTAQNLIEIFLRISDLHYQLKSIVSKLKDIKYNSDVKR
jgi:hypothetical protein